MSTSHQQDSDNQDEDIREHNKILFDSPPPDHTPKTSFDSPSQDHRNTYNNKYRNINTGINNRNYNTNKYKNQNNNNKDWNNSRDTNNQRGYSNQRRGQRTRYNNRNNNNSRMRSFRNNNNTRNNRYNQPQYNTNRSNYNNNNNNNNYNTSPSSLRSNNSNYQHPNQNNSNRRTKSRMFIHKGQMQTQPQPQQYPKTITSEQCAYATMVINNPEYLSGAFTLAWSLMISGSTAHRIIIIDDEINNKYGEIIDISKLFTDKFIIPKKLHYTAIQKRWRKYAETGIYDWINTSFNKYYCFMLTQYSRIIMLDADQICVKNPDELFKLSCPAGICSFYSELNNTLQHKKHGIKIPNADIRRSYERQWGIRGCLFMIEPSTNTFNDIIQQLEYLECNNNGIGDKKCFLGADEKFLTKYYMTTNGDLADSEWTHIHTKFSRLSYIDKTTLPEDPYFLHFCTFKPWKSPGNDKWMHEAWEDIAIWVFGSTSTLMYINKHLAKNEFYQQKYGDNIQNIMSPDAQFYANVVGQDWSKKYLNFGLNNSANNILPQNILLNLYHIMANSYREKQLKKQNKAKDLKKKIRETISVRDNETKTDIEINNKKNKNRFWSFDYSKHLLLSALLTQNDDKIPDKVIWQFWDKDENDMPENIKFCVNSVRKNNPDWKHVLITPNNVWKYLNESELPENVFKFEKACHISDVVRVAVLAKYGGIYCDATIICFKNCNYMNFNFFWDNLLMEQGYDFVGFKYDHQKTKWKNDEKFCCWFMASKKDNGLMYSWLNKINILMKGKVSNSQLDIIDLLFPNNSNNAFKKYVALGPLILDELFEEYCHYHSNFKYKLYDPRDFALLDQFFNYEPVWYLNGNDEYNFKEWFSNKSPHFIKLFCADKGTKQLYKIIKENKEYTDDKQVKLKDIIDAQLIISDIFQFV